MFGIGKKLKTKKAGITIEIALSLALMVVVLFLVLGLFSNNLQAIASHSGILNFFSKKNEVAKTFSTADYQKVDPTQTQVNVQVVADQGLDFYLAKAQNTVDQAKNATTPLSQQQIEDLARAITALSFDNSAKNPNDSVLYSDLRAKYKINIPPSSTIGGQTSTISIKSIGQNGETIINSLTYNCSSHDELASIKNIYSAPYKLN